MEFNVAVALVIFVVVFAILPVALECFEGIWGPYIYISVVISPVSDAYMLNLVPYGIDEDVIVLVFWNTSFPHQITALVLAEFPVCARVVLFHEFPPGNVLAVYRSPHRGNSRAKRGPRTFREDAISVTRATCRGTGKREEALLSSTLKFLSANVGPSTKFYHLVPRLEGDNSH